MFAVEFDSFAALIQATKERDAARKAKQQQAQLATPPTAAAEAAPEAVAAARAAIPQAVDQSSDQGVTVAANGQPAVWPERQPLRSQRQPPGFETELAACPAQPSDKLYSALPRSTSSAKQKSQNAHHEGLGSMHIDAADSMHIGEQSALQDSIPAEADYRVDLTLGDTPSKLSQDSLAVEVEDDASPVPSQKVQDQRALQQLQLLNNSTEPVAVSGACNRKSIRLSQDKDPAVSSVPYQGVVAELSRTEHCLGPLDDIIEDTDSDVEGLMQ